MVSGSLFYGDFFMSIKQVHLSANGKGGIGKTIISSLLAQYFLSKANEPIHLYDTDPVNHTFNRYAALNVKIVNIVGADSVIDHSKFDDLVEDLISKDGIAVVDSGSTTFLSLMQYIKSNGVIEVLHAHGVELIFHIPLQSSGGLADTLEGLHTILETFTVPVVVWLNQNLGEIKDFKNSKLYEQYADRILGVCEIVNRHNDLFDSDIQRMTENHLTIEEIKQSTDPEWRLMNKQRINIFYNDICKQLDAIPLFTAPAAKQKEKADKVEKSTAAA